MSNASRCWLTLVVVMVVSWLPMSSYTEAQTSSSERRMSTAVIYTENDDWWPDTGDDKNYTNGFRFTLDRNYDMWRVHRLFRLFGWVPKHVDCSFLVPSDSGNLKCVSTSFHVGQQFYTPDDISVPDLIPEDRPYAGWLYVGGSWMASTASSLVRTNSYLGATGKASFADRVQTAWHAVRQVGEPQGWEHQIGERFGLVVDHSRHWAFDVAGSRGRVLEFVPYIGFTAGNIVTDAYAGARFKVGYNITRDWLQTGIAPRVERRGADVGNFEVHLVFDFQSRALGYNAFIDATDQHELDRRHLVADGGIGFGFRVGRFSVDYRVAFVSPEYTEALVHDYKALRFAYTLLGCRRDC